MKRLGLIVLLCVIAAVTSRRPRGPPPVELKQLLTDPNHENKQCLAQCACAELRSWDGVEPTEQLKQSCRSCMEAACGRPPRFSCVKSARTNCAAAGSCPVQLADKPCMDCIVQCVGRDGLPRRQRGPGFGFMGGGRPNGASGGGFGPGRGSVSLNALQGTLLDGAHPAATCLAGCACQRLRSGNFPTAEQQERCRNCMSTMCGPQPTFRQRMTCGWNALRTCESNGSCPQQVHLTPGDAACFGCIRRCGVNIRG